MARALLAARDARANVQQPFGFDVAGAAYAIVIIRVAAVNDNIPLFQVRDEQLDKVIHRLASLDQQHDTPRTLQ